MTLRPLLAVAIGMAMTSLCYALPLSELDGTTWKLDEKKSKDAADGSTAGLCKTVKFTKTQVTLGSSKYKLKEDKGNAVVTSNEAMDGWIELNKDGEHLKLPAPTWSKTKPKFCYLTKA